MAGPARQTTNTIIIPPGEGRRLYSPVSLAWYIENLETESEDVLKSVVGPSILRIGESASVGPKLTEYDGETSESTKVAIPKEYTQFGWVARRPHSIFSASLLNGSANTLLYRAGGRLYRFTGGVDRPFETLVTGLTSESNPKFPDQYVVINDKVVWTNGEDRARIINYDGSVFNLGFDKSPSTPLVSGPTQPEADDIPQYYPNALGYSWPGRIGTPGDLYAGRLGSLLSGQWYYHVQYEGLFGNLSPFSIVSEPASIKASQAQPFESMTPGSNTITYSSDASIDSDDARGVRVQVKDGTEIDDLTRRFLVSINVDAPEHTAAVRIFRTPDTLHVDNTPRFLSRIPGSKSFIYDDNNSDADLGTTWSEVAPVPIFRVACSHQGRLIIGNTPADPGVVRRSEPGFPGTFPKNDFIYPDAGGAEITGLASHNGVLLAFTKSAVYAVSEDFASPQPLSLGVGCIAPRSIAARSDGTLFWLGRDGFYGMKQLGDIVRMSSPIDSSFKLDVNLSRANMAVAAIDSDSGEYRCALSAAGGEKNELMFCYDGKYWRRQTLGIHIADMTQSSDWRRHTYAIGSDPRERRIEAQYGIEGADPSDLEILSLSRVFLWNRQTTDYFAPARRIRYRSGWMVSAEGGLVPLNVRSLYVGLKDAWNGYATVRVFKNNSWKPVQEMRDLRLVGVDDESDMVKDVAGSAKLGASKMHDPRLFWRQVPVDLHNVSSWAFEIELIGFPGPAETKFEPNFGSSSGVDNFDSIDPYDTEVGTRSNLALRSLKEFKRLFNDPADASAAKDRVMSSKDNYELGRLRIAAFAFDTSIATQGSPLGRVPDRNDQ